MTERSFTPKRVADAIGVSESSLKRWCDRGMLDYSKTAGGHRRITTAAVIRFLRESGHAVIQPDLLDLPSREQFHSLDAVSETFAKLLMEGNEMASRELITRLFMSEVNIASIFDSVFQPAFQKIGELWECGSAEVYQERRACEIASRTVHLLRDYLPKNLDAPVALCGGVPGDPYTLAPQLVELVMQELGWNAIYLGTNIPFNSYLNACSQHRPKLMAFSISSRNLTPNFKNEFNEFYDCLDRSIAVVIGGRGVTEEIKQDIRYTNYSDNLTQFAAFAETMFHQVTLSKS